MTENEAKTKWCAVRGYEGLYAVSDQGSVRSIARLKPYRGGFRRVAERILAPAHVSGYPRVLLWREGRAKPAFVHRLVAEAFIGGAPTLAHQVNHKNGVRDDPRADNLEWVTPSENQAHSYRELGRKASGGVSLGSANGRFTNGFRSGLAGEPQ